LYLQTSTSSVEDVLVCNQVLMALTLLFLSLSTEHVVYSFLCVTLVGGVA